ncbi:hypothetical protein STEG23_018990 [Scotinomys teguina]
MFVSHSLPGWEICFRYQDLYFRILRAIQKSGGSSSRQLIWWHVLMALRKSSLSLLSTESDSEELPTFAFLKKEPPSADRNQPQRENVVVVTSDSEASCPLSPGLEDPPFVLDAAEAPTHAGPVRVLSSESEDEEAFVPLAERITGKFLTHKQLSPEHSSSSLKTVLDHPNNTSGSCDWKKQPFPKIPADVPQHSALEKSPASDGDSVLDSPCHQLPAHQSTCSELAVTTTIPDIPLPQKRTKRSQKDGKDWVEEPTILVLLLAETFMSMVNNLEQGSPGSTEKRKETLRGFVTDVTARTGKALSLVIVDQEKCFTAQNPPRRRKSGMANKQAKEKQQKRQESSTRLMMSRVDMEEALVDLQLHTEVQVRRVQSWKELTDFTCAFTKAVAEAPFKTQTVPAATWQLTTVYKSSSKGSNILFWPVRTPGK